MSGHFELGEIIKNHRESDVGKELRSLFVVVCVRSFICSSRCVTFGTWYFCLCLAALRFTQSQSSVHCSLHTQKGIFAEIVMLCNDVFNADDTWSVWLYTWNKYWKPLGSWNVLYCKSLLASLLTRLLFLSVPFLESPKYAPQRRESSRTLGLPHPHPFLRANSDNSMNVPDWIAFPNAAGSNIVSVQVITGVILLLLLSLCFINI